MSNYAFNNDCIKTSNIKKLEKHLNKNKRRSASRSPLEFAAQGAKRLS